LPEVDGRISAAFGLFLFALIRAHSRFNVMGPDKLRGIAATSRAAGITPWLFLQKDDKAK
jgi:hypothetical protein